MARRTAVFSRPSGDDSAGQAQRRSNHARQGSAPAALRFLCLLCLLLSACASGMDAAGSQATAVRVAATAAVDSGSAGGGASALPGASAGASGSAATGGAGAAARPDRQLATPDEAEGGPGLAGASAGTPGVLGPFSSPGASPGAGHAGSTATAPGGASGSAAGTTVRPNPFALDLYRNGDFVRQYTFDWCVGASIQMMLNMIRPTNERSRAQQQAMWELARDLSSGPYQGANPRGWTDALNELGAGSYALVAVKDYGEALRAAAAAITDTNRPVGLVMWGGRHAWVMSGFTSSGDPRTTPGFVVTGVRVLDPLYPYGSSQWGASPAADTLLRPAQLADQFVPRQRHRPSPDGRPDSAPEGSYVLVLPES